MSHFVGEVRTEWLVHEDDDRRMRLLDRFAFVDDHGREWEAVAGDVIDGASIPQFLWTLVGSPFIGDYRRATVLHDVECQRRRRPSREVHRMFYEAMRTDGVPEDAAIKFYTAVRLFGPKWEIGDDGNVHLFAARVGVRPALTINEVEAALDVVLAD